MIKSNVVDEHTRERNETKKTTDEEVNPMYTFLNQSVSYNQNNNELKARNYAISSTRHPTVISYHFFSLVVQLNK